MALFRRLFYRKPPDRLLEISERVYVFDCCFSSETLGDKEYKDYLGVIVSQLQDYFPNASFMVCNFREGDQKSHISDIMSEHDVTVMDYPQHYEGCPLLPLEMIHHFLRSSESWLSLEGQHNVLLMHCERGGWPVLAFMLAGLLLYRKQYNGEQKTLELVYKQAPKELLHLSYSLNPQPSHLRYLQYITRKGGGSDWPPKDMSFKLECIILRFVPKFDGEGGCRPIVRVYGQDPLTPTNRISKLLFSTPKTQKNAWHYRQENSCLKISASCLVQGDVVLECIHVNDDLEREVMMFRVMFNTAFIESDVLLLNNEEIDVAWNVKDQFPRDFKAEVLFSDFDAGESEVKLEVATGDDDGDFEGASTEEFFEVEEIFSTSELPVDAQIIHKRSSVDDHVPNSELNVVADKDMKRLESGFTQQSSNISINGRLDKIDRTIAPVEFTRMADEVENTFETTDSEPNVTEKLILLQKTEVISPTLEKSSEGSEPKTFYASAISNFFQKTSTADHEAEKLENLTGKNRRNIKAEYSISKEGMNGSSFERKPILNGNGHDFTILSVVDHKAQRVDTYDCQNDTEIEVGAYSDNWLETSSSTDQVESGPKIVIGNKRTFSVKSMALDEMNQFGGNKLAGINSFIQESSVLVPLHMEQKSAVDPSHLKCLNSFATDSEDSNVLESFVSESDLVISIFKESVLSDGNRKFGLSDAATAKTVDFEREDDHRESEEVRFEAKSTNKKTGSITQKQNNEKVLPPMPKKNSTNRSPPSNPVINKLKCNQQKASNLDAKAAKTKIVARWISPQKASDATFYRPSHPPSRYNSAPPSLAISSVEKDDEMINTTILPIDCHSSDDNVTSIGSLSSLSVSSITPLNHVLEHISIPCQHTVADSPGLHLATPSLPLPPPPPPTPPPPPPPPPPLGASPSPPPPPPPPSPPCGGSSNVTRFPPSLPSKPTSSGSGPAIPTPPLPPPKPNVDGLAPTPLKLSTKASSGELPPLLPPTLMRGGTPPPPHPGACVGAPMAPSSPPLGVPPPPPPPPGRNVAPPTLPLSVGRGAPAPPPPPPWGCNNMRGGTPSPPPHPGACVGAPMTPSSTPLRVPPPPPPPPGGRNVAPPPPPLSVGRGAPVPPPPPPRGCNNIPTPPPLGGCGAPPTPPRAPGVPPPPPIGTPPNGLRGPPQTSLVGGRGRGLSRPIGFGSSSLAPRRSSLKPLHWVKVTRAVQGSLWAEIQKSDDAPSVSEFDELELESLFSAVIPKSNDGSKSEGRRKSVGSKSDKVHLIELRRANNTGIMLTKVKIPIPDLMSSVLALDHSILDVDQVENLIKFCPTKEEMELLKAYTGDKEKLGKCEQFFLELMKVPRVESKLRVFSFKIQFGQQVSDLQKSLNTIDSACEQLRSSVKLKEIMKKILYLGNMLNQGTARGSAIGFRLDSLLKLTDTRAINSKMTLMHYLCKVISSRSPHLLDFHDDLTNLETASKIQLKSMAEEMQAIIKGLEKVELELTASESDGPVSEVFRKTLKEFIAVAGADVRSLSSLYSAVGRNADALVLYFGEDPARCPFEQVISTLMNFVVMFRRAHQENCKQADLEKKKALKGAEEEKCKAPNPRNKVHDMSLSVQLQQSLGKSKNANQQGKNLR